MKANQYAQIFFEQHPSLERFAPQRVLDKSGSGTTHPEARQSGDEIWIYPKFWNHAPQVQDFIFAHEMGHLILARYSLRLLIADLEMVGIDPWDTDKLPFGSPNMDEAFADSFASLVTDRDVLHRYPKWAAIVRNVLRTEGQLST